MTDLLDLREDDPRPQRRRRRGGRLLAVLFVLLLTAGLVVGAAVAVRQVFDGGSAADYAGSGTDPVMVQVKPGDNAGDVGSTLVAADVVKSRQAFFEVAAADPRATSLKPGFYELKLQMSAAEAFELLLDPASRVVGRVTVAEGLTVPQTLQVLAEGTEMPLAQYQAAAKDVGALGLPDYAQGRLEGFLFPATYDVEPGTTPAQVLTQMVDRFQQAAETVDLEARAKALGRTPYEVVVVASLIEREVRFDDEYGKVARVVYNRLDQGIPLGIDAAIAFGVGKTPGEQITASDLAKDTPYENRRKRGLPPTPIASPGEATLEGALNPEDSDVLYYVLATKEGRSFFTSDYQAFLDQRDKSRAEGVF
ncbi:MAG: putative periplasmic solute-binding protein [Frankiales bacterium]|nr:putative periplasmic solute-binding protein [Frankiales bacterium]